MNNKQQVLRFTGQKGSFQAVLIRSQRRTFAIQIKEGRVMLRAPLRMSETTIREAVMRKTDWIIEHLKTQPREVFSLDAPLLLVGGYWQTWTYLYAAVPCLMDTPNGLLFLGQEKARAFQLGRVFLEEQLIAYVRLRTAYFAKRMDVTVTDIRFRHYRARWGQCSRDGILSFSLNLIHCHRAFIDYVIVHELAHRRVFNHSAAFYAEVVRVLPNYREIVIANRKLWHAPRDPE